MIEIECPSLVLEPQLQPLALIPLLLTPPLPLLPHPLPFFNTTSTTIIDFVGGAGVIAVIGDDE